MFFKNLMTYFKQRQYILIISVVVIMIVFSLGVVYKTIDTNLRIRFSIYPDGETLFSEMYNNIFNNLIENYWGVDDQGNPLLDESLGDWAGDLMADSTAFAPQLLFRVGNDRNDDNLTIMATKTVEWQQKVMAEFLAGNIVENDPDYQYAPLGFPALLAGYKYLGNNDYKLSSSSWLTLVTGILLNESGIEEIKEKFGAYLGYFSDEVLFISMVSRLDFEFYNIGGNKTFAEYGLKLIDVLEKYWVEESQYYIGTRPEGQSTDDIGHHAPAAAISALSQAAKYAKEQNLTRDDGQPLYEYFINRAEILMSTVDTLMWNPEYFGYFSDKSSDITSFSGLVALMRAMIDLYNVTGKSLYLAKAVHIMEFVNDSLYLETNSDFPETGPMAYHHTDNGQPSKDSYCTGDNFLLLDNIYELRKVLSDKREFLGPFYTDFDMTITDTDLDGTLSPGESAEVYITLKNYSDFDLETVTATLTTNIPEITISGNPMLEWGNMASKEEKKSLNSVTITISSEGTIERTTELQNILFDLNISGTQKAKTINTGKIRKIENKWADRVIIPMKLPTPLDFNIYTSSIYDDPRDRTVVGNGNSIAESGETIELYMALEKQGPEIISVSASLNTNDPYVYIENGMSTYENYASNRYKTNSFYRIIIGDAPENYTSEFTLNILATPADQGDTEKTFILPFSMPINGEIDEPELKVKDVYFNDDKSGQSSGDSDGIVESGETIELTFKIKNTGGYYYFPNMEATASTTDPYITFINNKASFTEVGDYKYEINAPLVFKVSAESAPVLYDIELALSISTGSDYAFEKLLLLQLNSMTPTRVDDGYFKEKLIVPYREKLVYRSDDYNANRLVFRNKAVNYDITIANLSTIVGLDIGEGNRIIVSGVGIDGNSYLDKIHYISEGTFTYSIEELLNGAYSILSPSIFKDKMVWTDNRNGDYDIWLATNVDTTTPIMERITEDSADQFEPKIYNNIIVWTDTRNGNKDIYMYDLDNKSVGAQQITSDISDQYEPDIYENYIVWTDERNSNKDIFLFDLSNWSAGELQITYDTINESQPSIHTNRIVWTAEKDSSNSYLFLYDILIQRTVRLTKEDENDSKNIDTSPQLYENCIAWFHKTTDYDWAEVYYGIIP
jgi:beta propeller repeat protein